MSQAQASEPAMRRHRPRAHFSPRTLRKGKHSTMQTISQKERERRRKQKKAKRQKDQVHSRKLKIIPTSKIVEKLYDGKMGMPPPLPEPANVMNTKKAEPAPGKVESFAWQPTEFSTDTKREDEYNWDYFMDSGLQEEADDDFDRLFEDADGGDSELTYDHYYDSAAYNRKNDRSCASCDGDSRMCKMDKCTIS